MDKEPNFFIPSELSELLRIPASSLYELARRGKIPGAIKIGRHWRFSRQAVMAWLNRHDSDDPKPTPAIEEAKETSRPKKILVVEDDPLVLKSIQSLLGKQGYRVEASKDGFEALEKFERGGCWDLVISDIRMPKQDGIETVKKIRDIEKKQWRPATPVIFITGYADQETNAQALQLGARDYLHKPLDSQNLLNRVKKFAYLCN